MHSNLVNLKFMSKIIKCCRWNEKIKDKVFFVNIASFAYLILSMFRYLY